MKVSVCVPAYNAAQFLPAAIESVLRQGFGDLELIISDDASNDETASVCIQCVDRTCESAASTAVRRRLCPELLAEVAL